MKGAVSAGGESESSGIWKGTLDLSSSPKRKIKIERARTGKKEREGIPRDRQKATNHQAVSSSPEKIKKTREPKKGRCSSSNGGGKEANWRSCQNDVSPKAGTQGGGS